MIDSSIVLNGFVEKDRVISIIGTFFSTLGALFLLSNVIFLFIPSVKTSFFVTDNWVLFVILLLILLIASLIKNRPVFFIKENINGTEIWIEIKIGDIFWEKGDLIISTNTTFDTDITSGLISSDSLQGQYTQRFYKDRDINEEINNSIHGENHILITKTKKGKLERYDIGTVALLKNNELWAYLLAIADMNPEGNAQSNFENIQEALPKLWMYIAQKGRVKPLLIPIIGSGNARVNITKDSLIKEIIKSFIIASATSKFTEKLTIVITPSDYYKSPNLDLKKLDNFLKCQCEHLIYIDRTHSAPIGTGISK